jgi:hypothetical protein
VITPRRSRRSFKQSCCLLIGLFPTLAIAATDYTGFWKVDCADPYGLQIQHQSGQYAVNFCGPGGCGDHVDSVTPIEGDRLYEVISPTQIRIRYSAGYAPVYTKCSQDTHPVLKYSDADRAEGLRNVWISVISHLAYLAAAVWLYKLVRRRTAALPGRRRLIIRSGAAALLFSPGMYFFWPFWSPSFALLALVVELPVMSALPREMVFMQLAYTVGPIVIVWVVLLGAAKIRGFLQCRKARGSVA